MATKYEDGTGRPGASSGRALWVEQAAGERRMPDPVRESAVRAVLIVAVTLTVATTAFFLTVTGSWLALPLALCAIGGTVVATWGVLDVMITRQTWNQRYGVVSEPSSTARGRRRERRRSRRDAAAARSRTPVPQPRQPDRVRSHGEATGIWPPPSRTGR
ncbi:hypothetical protein ABZY44_16775 [Streptomyces sp. NPDC006544]|uniref:hypothetical protein n=1 Tax=Streptomyces sp. NPDC006544 TaxID=3154583 RepID=UPI00339E1C3C